MDDPAALEDERGLGERERDLGVLLDQDEGGPVLGSQTPDRRRQLLDHDRRQALERLVEQEQGRVRHQRPGDREHLLLAAGQLVAPAPAARGEAREERVGPGEVPAARARRHHQVLLDAQGGKDLALLRDPAEPGARTAMRGHPGQVAPAPPDGAAADIGVPHDRQEERGLAHAVPAQHGHAASRRHVERDPVQHDGVAVAGADAVQREQRLSHGRSGRGRPRGRAGRRRCPRGCLRSGSARRP